MDKDRSRPRGYVSAGVAFLASSAQEAIDLGSAPAASEDIVVIEAG
jgi:hypothetical protein